MKKITFIFSILLSALLLQCQSVLESPDSNLNFRAYGENGALLREGTIVLDTSDPGDVTGSWRIKEVRVSNIYEAGTLKGKLTDRILVIDLHPGWVDNNFVMRGIYDGFSYRGTWEQIGFPGVMDSGTFVASH